jgi:hypothetical protein
MHVSGPGPSLLDSVVECSPMPALDQKVVVTDASRVDVAYASKG